MRHRSGLVLPAIAALALLLGSPASQAFVTVGISITLAPPELPVYEQPPIPGPGYLWTPGYWAWADDGYYWVPGTWVEAPEPGYLWTPGYWGWADGLYLWHEGYWGPHVGFYGGVNYGFGYVGHGYEGGYWDHGAFRYNRAYNNIHEDVHITNVYNKTVIVNENHVSFNGGDHGIHARPEAQELNADHEHHLTPVAAQLHHEEGARGNPELRASANHGRPPIAATARAGEFAGHGVVAAREVTHPAGVAPHAAGGPAPQPAGVMAPHPGASGQGPHAPTNYLAAPSHATPPPPAHGTPPEPGHGPYGGPPAPSGAGVAAHASPPGNNMPHGGPAGGAAAGHPGGGTPPPPHEHEHEPHGAHDHPEGHR
jgi:WXXGXW repeat (2 copies)